MDTDYVLKVNGSRTVMTPSDNYTAYSISLEAASSTFRLRQTLTWRRFSDFVWLRKVLDATDKWSKPPSLPSRRRFWNLMDPDFVQKRREKLEQWLIEVLLEPLYLCHSALHLFLQTDLPVSQMDCFLQGKITEDRMEEMWTNNGKLQAHNLLHNFVTREPREITFTLEDLQPPSFKGRVTEPLT